MKIFTCSVQWTAAAWRWLLVDYGYWHWDSKSHNPHLLIGSVIDKPVSYVIASVHLT